MILVSFRDCPNAEPAKALLKSAGLKFREVVQDDLSANDPLRLFSSPTLLKNGKIIFGSHLAGGTSGCTLSLPSAQELRELLAKP